jgi:hypothetical protein
MPLSACRRLPPAPQMGLMPRLKVCGYASTWMVFHCWRCGGGVFGQ